MKISTAAHAHALAISSVALAMPVEEGRARTTFPADNWALLPVSPDLDWTPCMAGFLCTRLEVPLDYDNPRIGTTDIAIMKYESQNQTSSTQDFIVNPGGPGLSGVDFLFDYYPLLAQQLGPEHNYIGFDPRGVRRSGPDLSCFPENRDVARYFDDAADLDHASKGQVAERFARAGAWGKWCNAAHSAEDDMAKYANTVATAQDMNEIIELMAEQKGQTPEEAKLWYYGTSYGTVLGSVFASLYPEKVGRMILDSAVHLENYYTGKLSANVVDADKILNTFYAHCNNAGYATCAVWDSTPTHVRTRVNNILRCLRETPIPVTSPDVVDVPTIVTIDHWKQVLKSAVFAPSHMFPQLADILGEIEKRNGTTLARLAGAGRVVPQAAIDKPIVDEYDESRYGKMEPARFILCNDANGRFNLSTAQQFADHVADVSGKSNLLGGFWSQLAVNCRSLDVRAPPSQVFDDFSTTKKTSSPILFLGTDLDPVAPLQHAKNMTDLFHGSSLLVQGGMGHGVLHQASDCTMEHLRRYLDNATVPVCGTTCEPVFTPFKVPQPDPIAPDALEASRAMPLDFSWLIRGPRVPRLAVRSPAANSVPAVLSSITPLITGTPVASNAVAKTLDTGVPQADANGAAAILTGGSPLITGAPLVSNILAKAFDADDATVLPDRQLITGSPVVSEAVLVARTFDTDDLVWLTGVPLAGELEASVTSLNLPPLITDSPIASEVVPFARTFDTDDLVWLTGVPQAGELEASATLSLPSLITDSPIASEVVPFARTFDTDDLVWLTGVPQAAESEDAKIQARTFDTDDLVWLTGVPQAAENEAFATTSSDLPRASGFPIATGN